ncbi:MAG: nucleoside deaminase [Fibrella sp.]|nr:nucleoside deaminase [Armatimonadota bacterium]
MTHEELLQEAIRLSLENQKQGGGPFGAVIARAGKIIAASGNRVTATNDPTAHAEVSTIRLACENLQTFTLTGCEIYSSCEPCPMCLGAIYWARLDALHFAATRGDAAQGGFDDAFLYEEFAKPITDRSLASHHVVHLQKEAIAAFESWREKMDRVAY